MKEEDVRMLEEEVDERIKEIEDKERKIKSREEFLDRLLKEYLSLGKTRIPGRRKAWRYTILSKLKRMTNSSEREKVNKTSSGD